MRAADKARCVGLGPIRSVEFGPQRCSANAAGRCVDVWFSNLFPVDRRLTSHVVTQPVTLVCMLWPSLEASDRRRGRRLLMRIEYVSVNVWRGYVVQTAPAAVRSQANRLGSRHHCKRCLV